MKVMVKSVTLSKGISFKNDPNGQPFAISTVNCLSPLQERTWQKTEKNNSSGSLTGFGAQDYELPLDSSALSQFAGFDYPIELDLATDDRIMFGRMTSVVVGIKTQPTAK